MNCQLKVPGYDRVTEWLRTLASGKGKFLTVAFYRVIMTHIQIYINNNRHKLKISAVYALMRYTVYAAFAPRRHNIKYTSNYCIFVSSV